MSYIDPAKYLQGIESFVQIVSEMLRILDGEIPVKTDGGSFERFILQPFLELPIGDTVVQYCHKNKFQT